MNIWRLMTHHEVTNKDFALQWSLKHGRIAIGWGRIGALSAHSFGGEMDVRASIKRSYPELSNSTSGGFSLWSLYTTMKKGDLVILRGKKDSCVVEVTGDYFFNAKNTELPDYFHQRAIQDTQFDPNKLWQGAGKMAKDGGSIYRTLIRCERRLSPVDL